MIYSIVNGFSFSLSINKQVVFETKNPVGENLLEILLKYIDNVNNITAIYLCTGPGSLVASRSLVSFFLGLNSNNNFKIYYIDSMKDILLNNINYKNACFPVTNKKFIVGKKNNGEYTYEFLDYDPLIKYIVNNITEKNPLILDQNIYNIEENQLNNILKYPHKIIHWNSNDLIINNITNHNLPTSIVHYSLW